MIQGTHDQTSSLLILSNSQNNTSLLKAVLSSYFKFTSQDTFLLTTKYYKANIRLSAETWPTHPTHSQPSPQNQPQPQNEHKQDLLIMLAAEEESFSADIYDFVIARYNPDNFILLVNTSRKDVQWRDEQIITTQVNNFIEIVKEDLQLLAQSPPQRAVSGLLADNFQEGSIFSLLDLIQTTQWSCIQRVDQPKKGKKEQPFLAVEQSNLQAGPLVATEQKQQTSTTEQKQQTSTTEQKQQTSTAEQNKQPPAQKQQQKPQQHQPDRQLTEEQLEQQMVSFQAMVRDMMAIKEMGRQQVAADSQRKQKAEQLINRLLSGNLI